MRDPVVLGVASAALLVVAFALLLGAASWPSQVVGGFAAAAGGYFATAVATLAVDVVGTGGLDVSEGVETCVTRDDGRWRVYLHRRRGRRWRQLSELLAD